MIKRTQRKISQIREQPEEDRLRAVSRYTILIGIIIVAIWLVILLPLQISLKQEPTAIEQLQQQEEQQARQQAEQATPTPTPTPTSASLFSPTPQP